MKIETKHYSPKNKLDLLICLFFCFHSISETVIHLFLPCPTSPSTGITLWLGVYFPNFAFILLQKQLFMCFCVFQHLVPLGSHHDLEDVSRVWLEVSVSLGKPKFHGSMLFMLCILADLKNMEVLYFGYTSLGFPFQWKVFYNEYDLKIWKTYPDKF